MQNRSPLSDLIALSFLSALLSTPPSPLSEAKKAAQPEPAPAPEPMSLEQMLGEIFGAPPAAAPRASAAPIPSAQVCVIPQDIADRAGMNDAGFDPHSLEGRTVALLAAALANLRELRGLKTHCNPAGAAKCAVADSNIGAAIAAINLSNHV